MKLYTERKGNDYIRIVDICINKSSNELPFINDSSTCKLLIIRTGALTLQLNDEPKLTVSAPFAMFLSNTDHLIVHDSSRFHATTVFFQPSAINDGFTYEYLSSGDIHNHIGTTLYQDYHLISNFFRADDAIKIVTLTDTSLTRIMQLIEKMDNELQMQYDGFWPCRSRSFFIELLFFLNFTYLNNPYNMNIQPDFVSDVISYLNQNINSQISLDSVTKAFHVNRNYLNAAFTKSTGRTCLGYLLKIRIDLAKLFLSETQISLSEICRRVGYLDDNYFIKVFKKECGQTPIAYRNEHYSST